MSRLDSRVNELEQKAGTSGDPVTSICVHFVSPGPDGPVNKGAGIISIIGGEEFKRHHYDSYEAFVAAASANHLEVHGSPLRLNDRE